MATKTPVKATFSGSNVTGLAEYQSGDFIGLSHGGIGASLSIGTAGQVLKVNSGASALEFGSVTATLDIDTANDLTGSTLATTDLLLASDGGTEGKITLSQLDTLFSGTTKTLTNKTLTSAVLNTGVSGTAVLDEDNMATNSATQLATQQSIKAYVDAQLTASDLDFAASAGGDLSIDLDSERLDLLGGTGIDTTGSGNVVTFAIDSTVATLAGTQTFTNKTLTSPKINEDVAVTSTATELNLLDGVSGLVQADFTKLAAVTASAAELNTLTGVTAVVGELNSLDLGSTAIGTAIASKAVVLDANKDYTGIRRLDVTRANIAQVALSSSSNSVAWDASAAPNAYHVTTESTTFAAPSNNVEGAFICVEINYNGSHTIAFNTIFNFAADTAPTFTSSDGKTDILVFRYNGAVYQEVGRTLNISEA